MPDRTHSLLVNELSKTWPIEWRVLDATIQAPESHPLYLETEALNHGKSCTLPYFTKDKVAWLTIAPSSDSLRFAIQTLRAWLLPSYGWEHSARAVVSPGTSQGPLAPLLTILSPAGYFRWWTTIEGAKDAARKLREIREMESLRPSYVSWREPSLLELRQEFQLSLATGNREKAEQTIDEINKRQLDTAINTRFMRLHLHQNFREYARIIQDERLSDLLQMRMPEGIRTGVVDAFYTVFIGPAAEQGDAAALSAYKSEVHDRLAGVLRVCRPTDGETVAKMLALFHQCDPSLSPNRETTLFDALRVADWRTVQEIGAAILLAPAADTGQFIDTARHLVAMSFQHHPNAALRSRLQGLLDTEPSTLPPQDWTDYLLALRTGEWERCKMFLNLPDRSPLRSEDPDELSTFVETIREIFTDPTLEGSSRAREYVHASLPAIVEDVILDPLFPVSSLCPVYCELLSLWSSLYSGSQNPIHTSVLLRLSAGVLTYRQNGELLVFDAVRQWWQARRTRILLPFVAEALDLLAENSAVSSESQTLWVDAMEVRKRWTIDIPASERHLWRNLAIRLGIDQEIVEIYLSEPELTTSDEQDPLALVALAKVAIVSLHEKAAQTAASLIKERTKAQLVVVSETAPGPSTESAQNADVILFVWAATKHAIFRAFDHCREKIVYVQGTGPSSIVLALERWATARANLN